MTASADRQYGHLIPYGIIETDLLTLEQVFVKDFPESATRAAIFADYLTYLDQLRGIIGATGFYQWIDGSFVTRKQNPKDIDFVTFVDYEVYQRYENQFEQLRKVKFQRGSKIDGYFVKTYPEAHQQRQLFEFDRMEWYFDFGQSFVNRRHKGIIQINF